MFLPKAAWICFKTTYRLCTSTRNEKYNPYSLLTNERNSFEGYEPRNYNHEYSKEMTMYDAILESANVPAVSLLNELGVEEGKQYLEKEMFILQMLV